MVPEHADVDPARRLQRVLSAVTAHGPFDAVVITGDVCDDGAPEAARAARDLVAPAAAAVFAVPGNHDSTDVIAEVFGKPEAEFGAWRMVGVATNIAGQVAGAAAPVVAALDDLDATEPDRPAVVLTHHPLRSPSTHEWFTLAGADVLEQRLRHRTAPLVVLSGHTHQPYETSIGAAQLLGAPSTFYGIRHAGDAWTEDFELTGARIIDLHDDGHVATRVVIC